MSEKSITSRDMKGRHFIDLCREVYDGANLDDIRAGMLNERGGEFQDKFVKLVAELSVTDKRYAEEEITSWGYYYPEEHRHKGPKPLSEQVDALAEIFSLSRRVTDEYINGVLPTLTLPDGAEGWFAFPSVDAVAKQFFPEIDNPSERYYRARDLVLQKISNSRGLDDYRENMIRKIEPDRVRINVRTEYALDAVTLKQKGDILIVAAQLGMRHRGRSIRRAREMLADTEFLLTPFEVGCIILTHPKRLINYPDLRMDCAGDELAAGDKRGNVVGDFLRAPTFDFRSDGHLRFFPRPYDQADPRYGSVSAFFPQ